MLYFQYIVLKFLLLLSYYIRGCMYTGIYWFYYQHSNDRLWRKAMQSFWRCSFFTSTDRTTSWIWLLNSTSLSDSSITLLLIVVQTWFGQYAPHWLHMVIFFHDSHDFNFRYFRRVEKNSSYFKLGSSDTGNMFLYWKVTSYFVHLWFLDLSNENKTEIVIYILSNYY